MCYYCEYKAELYDVLSVNRRMFYLSLAFNVGTSSLTQHLAGYRVMKLGS
jgi:hypothetical protein